MLTLYVATPLTGAVMRNQSEIHVWRAMVGEVAFVGVGLVVVVREEEGPASPDQRAVSSHVTLAHARANAPVRARLRRVRRGLDASLSSSEPACDVCVALSDAESRQRHSASLRVYDALKRESRNSFWCRSRASVYSTVLGSGEDS